MMKRALSHTKAQEMKFLHSVKGYIIRLGYIQNEWIREELNIFSVNDRTEQQTELERHGGK